MVKHNQSTDKEVLDLQVFITRSPSQKTTKYKGLPSYFISSEGFRNLTRAETQTVFSPQKDEPSIAHKYVAIANSSAVAEISFPFEAEDILTIIQKLDCGQVKLVECMDFGVKLFNFIFQGSIRDLFRELSNQDQILRLTISTPIAELAVLPWELMCDIKSGFAPQFLCFQPQIRFCRALHLFDRSKFEARKQLGNEKVKFLLVTANPITTNYLDVGTEERLIRFVIDESPELSTVELDVIHNASVDSLREKLLNFKPHILHFSGHGGYRDDEDLGYILLTDKDNPQQPDYVNSYRFSAIVQEANCVQLAFLSTCRGAAVDDKSAFSGVAQLLHANGVSEVAALSFFVLDRTGHAILVNFYRYLLRYGLTVEESIARVRKLLFINGYSHSESFGLTLYQGNSSLYREATEKLSEMLFSDGRDFDKTVASFEAIISSQRIAEMRIADILRIEEIEKFFAELNPTPEEVFLTIKIFGEPEIGFETLKEISKLNINRTLFLKNCELAKRLSLEPNEGKLFPTAFIIDVKGRERSDEEEKENDNKQNLFDYKVAQKLHKDFLRGQIKEIVRTASTVNGLDRVFVTQCAADDANNKFFVADISNVKHEDPEVWLGIGDPRWDRICYLVRDVGCALIVTGDERVKLVVNGQQISEYRSGLWRRANLKDFRQSISLFSKKCSIDKELLLDVLNKCIFASEHRKGLTFLIQRKVNLIDRCHEGYRKDLTDLSEQKISYFDSRQYIERVKGLDNAIILTQEGYTLAVSASISVGADTQVDGIPGTGSRHLSAQKITKETDAIAFVVSEDRPITVFYNGQIEFRTE